MGLLQHQLWVISRGALLLVLLAACHSESDVSNEPQSKQHSDSVVLNEAEKQRAELDKLSYEDRLALLNPCNQLVAIVCGDEDQCSDERGCKDAKKFQQLDRSADLDRAVGFHNCQLGRGNRVSYPVCKL